MAKTTLIRIRKQCSSHNYGLIFFTPKAIKLLQNIIKTFDYDYQLIVTTTFNIAFADKKQYLFDVCLILNSVH